MNFPWQTYPVRNYDYFREKKLFKRKNNEFNKDRVKIIKLYNSKNKKSIVNNPNAKKIKELTRIEEYKDLIIGNRNRYKC